MIRLMFSITYICPEYKEIVSFNRKDKRPSCYLEIYLLLLLTYGFNRPDVE